MPVRWSPFGLYCLCDNVLTHLLWPYLLMRRFYPKHIFECETFEVDSSQISLWSRQATVRLQIWELNPGPLGGWDFNSNLTPWTLSSVSSLSPSPLLQALRLCGQEAGQHDGQRQPPLRRDGPGAARQRHRQLRAEDDRRAEAMRAARKKKPWRLFLSPFGCFGSHRSSKSFKEHFCLNLDFLDLSTFVYVCFLSFFPFFSPFFLLCYVKADVWVCARGHDCVLSKVCAWLLSRQ